MSLIDVAVRGVLAANGTVTGLVSTRIYPDRLPINPTLPALTYSLISEVPDPEIPGYRRARVQVSCWSDPEEQAGVKSPVEVNTVAEAVISALHVARLDNSPRSWSDGTNTYKVESCLNVGSNRLLEDPSGYLHVPCDFAIEFRR